MTVRFAASATTNSKTLYNYAHTNNHSLQNAEEEPIRRWNERSRTRRTHEVPFIAGWSHFTRISTWFRSPASSPTGIPCNIHAAATITTAQSHHFTSSPLPFVVTTSFVTTSLSHHFPRSPLPWVITSPGHHFPSSPPLVIATTSLDVLLLDVLLCDVVFCDVMLCDVLFVM